MEAIKFSNDEMVRLESLLSQLITGFRGDFEAIRYLNILRKFISDYRSSGIYLHGEIRPDIPHIINILKQVSPEAGKSVAEQVKQSCKCCVFHADNCMINIIYIIFKSLELNKQVDCKDIRPNMRILF